MAGAVHADRTILSEARQWPPADRYRADAAHLFRAAMVQPVGPGGRRGALRFGGDARFCRHRSRPRAGAGRDDGVPLPLSAGNARSRPATVRRGAAHLAAKGLKVATGTIVDATIINAPSSTKNAA